MKSLETLERGSLSDFTKANSLQGRWFTKTEPKNEKDVSALIETNSKGNKDDILSGIATLVVDGSSFPEKSYLVAAHWRCSGNEILLATGNFLSSVELQHRNAYVAELCGCLAFVKFIAWIVGDSPPSNHILVTTGTDCAAVINRISYVPPVTPFSTYLH